MGLQSPGRFGGKKNKRLTGSVRNRITKPARGCCSTPQLCLRAQTLALGSAIRKARRLRWHGRPAREEGMGHGPEAHATAGAEGSDGTVYGWGVTDVTNYSMYHMAWATTTLTSPVKHRQASSTASAQNWTRADVSLPFDPDDLGTYSVSTFHEGYCYWIYAFILAATSLASASACDFDINGAAYPVCDALTLNHTVYQAYMKGGCTAVPHPNGSDLTFTGTGSVYPDHSTQSFGGGAPPTLHAYYDA